MSPKFLPPNLSIALHHAHGPPCSACHGPAPPGLVPGGSRPPWRHGGRGDPRRCRRPTSRRRCWKRVMRLVVGYTTQKYSLRWCQYVSHVPLRSSFKYRARRKNECEKRSTAKQSKKTVDLYALVLRKLKPISNCTPLAPASGRELCHFPHLCSEIVFRGSSHLVTR